MNLNDQIKVSLNEAHLIELIKQNRFDGVNELSFAAHQPPKYTTCWPGASTLMLLSFFNRSTFLRPEALGKLAFINLRRDGQTRRGNGRRSPRDGHWCS